MSWWRLKATQQKLLIFHGPEVDHRGDLSPLQGQGADVLRLGHQPHHDFEGCAPTATTPAGRHLDGLQGDGGQRPPGGQPSLRTIRQKATGDHKEIRAGYIRIFGEKGRVSSW